MVHKSRNCGNPSSLVNTDLKLREIPAEVLWRAYCFSTGEARESRLGDILRGILRRIHQRLTNIGPLYRAVRMAIDGKTSAIGSQRGAGR